MKKKLFSIILVVALLATLLIACSNNTAVSNTKLDFPKRDLEIYVPGSAGGGSDVFARTIAKIALDNKLFPKNITVVNKPGGSGSICYGLVAGLPADGYALATVSSSFFTGPITGQSPVSPADFTPIAALATDPIFMLVKSDAQYNTFKEFIEYAKANPGKLSGAGSSGHSSDRIVFEAIKESANLEMNFVPFGSGAEALTQVLGGHLDFTFANPSECMSQIEGKLIKPLVVTLEERFDLFPEVPTLIEEGIDFTLGEFRAIVGPKNMPEDIVKYYSDMIKQLCDTKDWEDGYLKMNMLSNNYLDYTKAGDAINGINEMYTEKINKIGDL